MLLVGLRLQGPDIRTITVMHRPSIALLTRTVTARRAPAERDASAPIAAAPTRPARGSDTVTTFDQPPCRELGPSAVAASVQALRPRTRGPVRTGPQSGPHNGPHTGPRGGLLLGGPARRDALAAAPTRPARPLHSGHHVPPPCRDQNRGWKPPNVRRLCSRWGIRSGPDARSDARSDATSDGRRDTNLSTSAGRASIASSCAGPGGVGVSTSSTSRYLVRATQASRRGSKWARGSRSGACSAGRSVL
jgi:hypothetical protein